MHKFNTKSSAERLVNNAEKMMMIILGCDGLWWVCTPRQAARLIKQGYELA